MNDQLRERTSQKDESPVHESRDLARDGKRLSDIAARFQGVKMPDSPMLNVNLLPGPSLESLRRALRARTANAHELQGSVIHLPPADDL